jgi:integrase
MIENGARGPKRIYGSGIIEAYGKRFRARIRKPDGTKPTLDIFDTEDEANKALDAFFAVAGQTGGWKTGPTLRTFGEPFLEDRELIDKVKSIGTDKSRWKNWILRAEFSDWPLPAITDVAIRAWIVWLLRQRVRDLRFGARRKPRKVSPPTAKHCLNLLRVALEKARLEGLIDTNPANGIEVPGLDEPDWDYLHLEDQRQWENASDVPVFLYHAVMFAYGGGQRRQDQWDLKLTDLHLDAEQPYFRFKMRKRRVGKKFKWVTVPLFGPALRAIKSWLEILPTYCPDNPLGLVWPAEDGGRRVSDAPGWDEWRKKVGIARHIKWHELRHTFGSSLVSGVWGRVWRLEEVRDVMGHSSIDTTERYAHLEPARVLDAGTATIGPKLAQTLSGTIAKNTAKQGRATQNSNLRPSAPESQGRTNGSANITHLLGQPWAKLATRYLQAVKSRSRLADRYALQLAQAVVESDLVQLAREVLDAETRTYSRATRLAEVVLVGSVTPSAREKVWRSS